MEDHGQIITHFEMLFGQNIDHEVIKMVLQACEWNLDEAHEKLTLMSDSNQVVALNSDEICPKISINSHLPVDSQNQSFAHAISLNRNRCAFLDSAGKVENLGHVTSLTKNKRDFFDSHEVDRVKKLINEKKVLIIMRGLPGSGKSTLAHFLCQNTVGIILSTDDYFVDISKNYKFNPALLPEAHQWNEKRAKLSIKRGFSTIFIDNTNLQLWEFEPYIRLGLANNYEIELLEPQTPWKYHCKELAKKCVHNITEKKIKEMKLRFDTSLCIDKVLWKLNVTKTSDANMALMLPKEFVDVSENYVGYHPDLVNKCTNVLEIPTENNHNLNVPEISFSPEFRGNEPPSSPSENDIPSTLVCMSTIEKTEIDSHVPLADDLDQSWCNANQENKGSTENLEWEALNPSNVNNVISWDSSQNQNLKEVNGLDPKPARNIKKIIPTCLNDFKESDHDSIIWNTVDSSQLTWDCEKEVTTPLPITPSHRRAVPKMSLKADTCNTGDSPPLTGDCKKEVATPLPITPSHKGAVPKISLKTDAPEFCPETIEKSITPGSMVDSSTQFYTFDYSSINSDSKLIEGDPSSFIPGVPEVTTPLPITPSHKGAVPKISLKADVPEFCPETIEKSITHGSMVDSSTQFCTFDYSSINSDSKLIEGDPSSFILGVLEGSTPLPITPSHKGAVPKISLKADAPEFCPETIEKSITHGSMVDSSTQFCTFDYSSINSDSKLIEGDPSSFIPGVLEEVKLNEPLTKTKLVLHKSSMTDEFVAPTLESYSALETLVSFFPSIPRIELQDVFERCDFDIDWATCLLIDGGYEIADSLAKLDPVTKDPVEEDITSVERAPIRHISIENEVKDASSETNQGEEVSDEYKMKLLQMKKEIESSFQLSQSVDDKIIRLTQKDYCHLNICKIKKQKYNVDNASNVDNEFLLGKDEENFEGINIELSPSFASQLLNTFGPIGSSNQISDFTKEQLSINLPLELSYQVFQCWTETLERIVSDKIIVPSILKEDEDLAKKLQEEENAKTIPEVEVDVPTSMQEIIDLEKALHLSNIHCNRKLDEKMSSILSLKKLQEEFSHVDPSAVEIEYYNQSNKYEATKTLLCYKYGSGKSAPKVVLAPGTVIQRSKNYQNSENYDGPNEVLDWDDLAVIVEDPQIYRDEAQIQFLERKKALEKVKEASRNGMSAVASYYAQIANEHLTKFKEANQRAAKKIVDAVNSNRAPNTLDLHLLHVAEALKETQRFLSGKKRVLQQRNVPELEVTIITGKGVHSVGKEPRLKPAIGYFLKCEGYVVKEYAGMFKVKLQNDL